MKKVITLIGSLGLLAGLSQVSFGQLGQLALDAPNTAPYGGVGDVGGGIYAGTFLMTFTPQSTGITSQPFLTYCTDLNVDLVPTWGANMLTTTSYAPQPPINYVPLYGGTQAADNIIVGGELAYIADNYGQNGTPDQNAESQIAIWDIAEGGTGQANDGFFNSAQVAAWNFTNQATLLAVAEGEAQNAYNGGGGHERSAVDTWYQADPAEGNQDFLTPSGSPEPFTMAIGASGIGVALLRRIKRKA
jgi:hypothetical protein